MEWNEEAIERLRALWADGHSTAEIGRRLGVTKNAVVGKAHRLELPPRPSPIRRLPADGSARPPRRLIGPTLPPLPGPTAARPLPEPSPPPEMLAAAPSPPLAAAPEPPPARPAPPPPLRPVAQARTGRVSACCWPIGHPGTPSFRFCDGDAMTGKPYCAEHAQLAYVKVRDRREEAA